MQRASQSRVGAWLPLLARCFLEVRAEQSGQWPSGAAHSPWPVLPLCLGMRAWGLLISGKWRQPSLEGAMMVCNQKEFL